MAPSEPLPYATGSEPITLGSAIAEDQASVVKDAHDEVVDVSMCEDVLSHVFEFLDHETEPARREVIAEHLENCSSCLRQFGIEQEFKALVRRRCGGDVPPPGLRDRIKLQLTTVSFEEGDSQVSGREDDIQVSGRAVGQRR